MRRDSPLLTIALCISLAVHLLGLSALAWWYAKYTPPEHYAAIDREKLLIHSMSLPRPSRPPPAPPRRKKPQPPKFEMEKPEEMPKDDSGEAQGKGTANRSTPGQQPMEARQGYEQADLMRDTPDAAQLDPDSPLPAAAGSAVGSNASKQSTAQTGRYTPDFVAESKALADPNADIAKPAATHEGIGPLPVVPNAKDAVPVPSGAPTPVMTVSANARQTEVPQAIRGHRAISSDAESVAFAKANSISLHDGRVDGRQGLKVSPKIPRFGLASIHDAEVLGGFRVVIGAWVDADGNVSDTKILQSSGSSNIDLDYQNAIYNWTFEPPKDKDGHPTATMWAITCE